MSYFLVTGGCGFIGSHLVASLLEKGHKVRVVDNLSTGCRENISPKSELRVENICTDGVLESAMEGIDACFHLAAIASVECSIEHWVETHDVNLTGTIRVFNAARRHKTPVVYASSAAVYGDNADMPLTERSLCSPLTAYGADKLGSELHGRVAAFVHGIPNTGMRFFNVFGPRQDPKSPYSGVISIFTDKILREETITIFGDGEQTRDFIYVGDVVQFLISAMAHVSLSPEVFNVCRGESMSVNQLASALMSISSNTVDVHHFPARRGDIRTSIGSPASAARELGIVAQTSVTEGLRTLLEYIVQTSETEKTCNNVRLVS